MSEVVLCDNLYSSIIALFKKSPSSLKLTRRDLVDHGGRYYHQEETSNIVCNTIREEKEDMVMMVTHETRGW